MSDNSKSYVRVAFAIIAMAALGVHPALRSSGAAENERSSENASNTGDFIQPSVAGEVSSDVSGLSASSNDDALRAQLAELTTRLEQSPDDVDALVARAALYSHLKDAEKEQTDLLKAMKLSPDNAVAWHLYGYECLNREFTHLAISAFEKAAGLGSNDPHLFMRLGYAYSTVGKQQEAIANYTRAIEIKTDYGEAYFSRALVWNGMAEWDKAIADIDKAIEIGYRTWPIFFERGRAYQGRGDIEQAIASFTLAIEQRPDDATSHFGRAQMRYRSGDFKNAIADLDRAIEIEPGNAYYRACRGMAYFDQKDFDKGTADVLEAIRLNPGDLFVEYQLTTNKELSPEALKHGEEQLRNMLRDCPAMAQFVSPQDKLWQWAVRKFAGEDLGAPVHWDPTPPSLRLGCSLFGDQHAIRVSQIRFDLPDRRPCTFDELWSTAVFELHNVTSSPIWSDISQQVLDGKLNRDDYIVAVLESEELATQRTRAFYLKFYLPWIREKGMVDTSPARWRCGSFIPDADPQSRLAYWQKHSLWPLYAASYDHLLAQREYSQSNYDEVVKLLQALVTKDNLLEKEILLDARYLLGASYDATNRPEQAINEYSAILDVAPNDSNATLSRGIARFNAGLADAALEDFDRSLKIDGSSADAYCWRGFVRAQQEQFDAAMADFDEAIRIDPKSVYALSSRASEHSRRGNHDAALNDLARALEVEPENAELYIQRGSAWIDNKEFARAVADFDKAIQLAPQDSQGFAGRARTWYVQGDLSKSFLDWNAAVRLKPDDFEAYLERGNIHFLTKQYAEAFADASKAIELAPERPDVYSLRADVLLESDDPEFKRPDDALKDAQRSCELTQWQSSYYLALLASAYATVNDYTSAIEWQTKAVLLTEPGDRRINIKLLQQYKAQKAAEENRSSKSAVPSSNSN